MDVQDEQRARNSTSFVMTPEDVLKQWQDALKSKEEKLEKDKEELKELQNNEEAKEEYINKKTNELKKREEAMKNKLIFYFRYLIANYYEIDSQVLTDDERYEHPEGWNKDLKRGVQETLVRNIYEQKYYFPGHHLKTEIAKDKKNARQILTQIVKDYVEKYGIKKIIETYNFFAGIQKITENYKDINYDENNKLIINTDNMIPDRIKDLTYGIQLRNNEILNAKKYVKDAEIQVQRHAEEAAKKAAPKEAPAEVEQKAPPQGGGKKGRKTRKKSNRKTKKSGKKSGKKSRKPRRK